MIHSSTAIKDSVVLGCGNALRGSLVHYSGLDVVSWRSDDGHTKTSNHSGNKLTFHSVFQDLVVDDVVLRRVVRAQVGSTQKSGTDHRGDNATVEASHTPLGLVDVFYVP
jgi:hypothetical protein